VAERACVRPERAERDVVRDVSLALAPGEIVALVGPNGSGKSTLLASLAGALRPRAGTIRCEEADLYLLSARERARRLARLPQDPRCPDGLRVQELVAMGRYAHRPALSGLSARDRQAIREALQIVDMIDLRDRPVERLSGGERRRAWIALALAQEAPILILDEPTTALDLPHERELLDHLRAIRAERGVSILIALHDLEQAAALADRVALMYRGRLYAVGDAKDVLSTESLRDVFGVEAEIHRDPMLRIRVMRTATPLRGM
jgi:iron complex transport system ATP-binding protein